jgi:HPt (histidine-containing phosphotransfer) domain-containing protein
MDTEPVDLAAARRWVGGDRALLLELVGIFVAEASARLGELRGALTSRNVKELERVAHSLKGSAGILGASELQQACAELELAAAAKRFDVAPALLTRLDSELGRVVAFFRDPSWQSRGVGP